MRAVSERVRIKRETNIGLEKISKRENDGRKGKITLSSREPYPRRMYSYLESSVSVFSWKIYYLKQPSNRRGNGNVATLGILDHNFWTVFLAFESLKDHDGFFE